MDLDLLVRRAVKSRAMFRLIQAGSGLCLKIYVGLFWSKIGGLGVIGVSGLIVLCLEFLTTEGSMVRNQ